VAPAPGWYTLPSLDVSTSAHQTSAAPCEPGFYCAHGVRTPCPPGTYGDVSYLNSSQCSGLCAEGCVGSSWSEGAVRGCNPPFPGFVLVLAPPVNYMAGTSVTAGPPPLDSTFAATRLCIARWVARLPSLLHLVCTLWGQLRTHVWGQCGALVDPTASTAYQRCVQRGSLVAQTAWDLLTATDPARQGSTALSAPTPARRTSFVFTEAWA
jgi:hypothetical protein